eukprot:scaffold2549_cov333-Pavlova_lutheri.AAC.8
MGGSPPTSIEMQLPSSTWPREEGSKGTPESSRKSLSKHALQAHVQVAVMVSLVLLASCCTAVLRAGCPKAPLEAVPLGHKATSPARFPSNAAVTSTAKGCTNSCAGCAKARTSLCIHHTSIHPPSWIPDNGVRSDGYGIHNRG